MGGHPAQGASETDASFGPEALAGEEAEVMVYRRRRGGDGAGSVLA
ncbi:MAG: hypothetical protein O6929_04030 [candidate division NC10 bacterium]|nr:hypothetical protein [candidate division NC10 bacterium]